MNFGHDSNWLVKFPHTHAKSSQAETSPVQPQMDIFFAVGLGAVIQHKSDKGVNIGDVALSPRVTSTGVDKRVYPRL